MNTFGLPAHYTKKLSSIQKSFKSIKCPKMGQWAFLVKRGFICVFGHAWAGCPKTERAPDPEKLVNNPIK